MASEICRKNGFGAQRGEVRDLLLPGMTYRFLFFVGSLMSACGGSTIAPSSAAHDASSPLTRDAAGLDAHEDSRTALEAAPAVDARSSVEDAATEDAAVPLTTSCNGVPGLTGQALLDGLQPEYAATYTPVGTGAPTALTIRTHDPSGQASCHPSPCDECPPGWVAVDVAIDFVTADGLFDETFTTPVKLSPGDTTLSWDPIVPTTSIKGTYKPTLVGHPTVNLSFGGTFSGTTTMGSVVQQASNGSSGSVEGAGDWN